MRILIISVGPDFDKIDAVYKANGFESSNEMGVHLTSIFKTINASDAAEVKRLANIKHVSTETMTDDMLRGTTSQKLPITNAPSTQPKPRLTNPFLPEGGSPGRKLLVNLPNTLDLQGMNALGVANQGQNLRQNPGVIVAREELLRSRRQSSFDEGESVSSSSSDGTPTPRLEGRIREKYGGNTQRLVTDIETKIGMSSVPAVREARRVLGQQSQSISQMGGRMTGGTMTMADLPLESSGGAGARMASDTTNDMSN